MAKDNLKQKTSKGLFWSAIQNFSANGVHFLLMLFMARLLTPEDYGTIGLLTVFIQLSQTFINCGFGSALIRKNDRTQTDMSTVFYYNIVVSIICYIIIFFIAPYVADFYNRPILCPLLRVVALKLPIASLNTVIVAKMNFTMNFKQQTKITIGQVIISAIVGLTLAYAGFGVWALAAQQVTTAICAFVLCWTMESWRPSFTYSWKSFHEMFGYSSKLLLSRLLNNLYSNMNAMVIGKSFSPATLGHYSRANHWASMPSTNIVHVLNNVTFASLSKINDDNERLARVYRRMTRTSAFIIFPAMMGMSAIAQPLITFTVGAKWGLCSVLLQIICFRFMLIPINSLNNNIILAKGKSGWALNIGIFGKALALIILFGSIPYGIVTLCTLGVFSTLLIVLINTYYISKLIEISFIKQIFDLLPSFLIGSFMYLCVYFSIQLSDTNYIQIIIGIVVGAISYLGLSYILKRPELPDAISVVKDVFNRKKHKK